MTINIWNCSNRICRNHETCNPVLAVIISSVHDGRPQFLPATGNAAFLQIHRTQLVSHFHQNLHPYKQITIYANRKRATDDQFPCSRCDLCVYAKLSVFVTKCQTIHHIKGDGVPVVSRFASIFYIIPVTAIYMAVRCSTVAVWDLHNCFQVDVDS